MPDVSRGAAGDRQQIEKAIEAFISAYNAGNLDGVMCVYAPDCVKTRQGGELESRQESAERIARAFRDTQGRELTVVNDEIVVSGTLAYVRGSFTLGLTPRGGGPAEVVKRRFLEIWRKRAGRWLVVRTMDNAPPDGR